MPEDFIDVSKWIVETNCYEVMGQLRRLDVLTDADIKKAMGMKRQAWIEFMMEKAGLTPNAKNESG